MIFPPQSAFRAVLAANPAKAAPLQDNQKERQEKPMKLFSIVCGVVVFGLGCGAGTSSSVSRAQGSNAASSSTSAGPGHSSLTSCPATPAPTVFANALCLCGDYQDVGSGLVVSSTSGEAANVGVNGTSQVVGLASVDGSWVSYQGLSGVGQVTVRDNFVTTGDAASVSALSVGQDLSVGGRLHSVGSLKVGGLLRIAGEDSWVGSRAVSGLGPYQAPATKPCGCDPATFFDVAKAVTEAKTHNDNAAASLPTAGGVPNLSLVLHTGRYYLGEVTTLGQAHLQIEGAVALYLDGSLDSVGQAQLTLAAGAVLDLYVSGGIRTVGALDLGSSADPGALRLYLGGTHPVMMTVGQQSIRGLVYAPASDLQFVGNTAIEGAVFAHTLQGVGQLTIRHFGPSGPGSGICESGLDAGTSGGGGGGRDDSDAGVN